MQILHKLFGRSLVLRLGAAMAAITLFAIVGMTGSILIAESTQGGAEAINLAGSLRMQSHRIGRLLLTARIENSTENWRALDAAMQNFERSLNHPTLSKMLPKQSDSAAAYRNIVTEWRDHLRPDLAAYSQQQPARIVAPRLTRQEIALSDAIDTYVSHIDQLVKKLEQNTEEKITLLRALLGISLFLTLLVVAIIIYIVQVDVLVPLHDILSCAKEAGSGNLAVRVQHTGEDELGRLGHTFNLMAEDLSKLYRDLEARVTEKTAGLERSNRSLELLYHSITRLYNSPVSATTYAILLKDMEDVLGLGHGSACLTEINNDGACVLASTFDPALGETALCNISSCAECFGDGNLRLRQLGVDGARKILALPLRDMERQYGVLQMEVPAGRALEAWQTQLLEALCRHIGIAIGTARRAEQSHRLSLLEERAVIARELHDSLAQSLSYMKIQVSRLHALLARFSHAEAAEKVLEELREGLNGAYRQLRELLTTFRLRIEGSGLASTLEKTAAEFAERGGLAVNLTAHLAGCQLSANEEIHILQIVREALANVIHHAHAQQAQITIECGVDGMVTVTVDDNGVGISKMPETHHYGMTIMEERTHSLDGSLRIVERPLGGTRVELRFRPDSRPASSDQQNRTTG